MEKLLIICLKPLSMTLTYSNIFIMDLIENKEGMKIKFVDNTKLGKRANVSDSIVKKWSVVKPVFSYQLLVWLFPTLQ